MSDSVGHGRRKIPHNIPRGKTSHQRKGGCCSMAAAVRAARRGNYRLARRYTTRTVARVGAWAAPVLLLLAGVAAAVAYVLVDARWGA